MLQMPTAHAPATNKRKYLIIDGIGGVPLGRELFDAFLQAGTQAVHWDALKQKPRQWYGLSSALFKARNKSRDREGFSHLPRLPLEPLRRLLEQEAPTHVLVVGFLYKHYDVAQVAEMVRDAGARFMLYDTDSCNLYSKRREFLYFIEQELPRYDQLFSFSKRPRVFRETLGLEAHHLPFGAVVVPERRLEKIATFCLSVAPICAGSSCLKISVKICPYVAIAGAAITRSCLRICASASMTGPFGATNFRRCCRVRG